MIGLEEVVNAFELWRSNKSSKSTPIPESLWLMAKDLIPYYKKSHIQNALKVSGGQRFPLK